MCGPDKPFEPSFAPMARPAEPRARTGTWIDGSFVCVEIVDERPLAAGEGVCRCGACHGAHLADLAEKFL